METPVTACVSTMGTALLEALAAQEVNVLDFQFEIVSLF
jgi:hypothetical protein